jgi:membrane protease YdiL (CAAX protease family)
MLSIKKKLYEFHFLFIHLDKWKIILLAVIINFLNTFFFSFISNVFFNMKLSKGFRSFDSLMDEIIIAILVAPLVETIIFQYGIIETFKSRYKPLICCIISAFLFALIHMYNYFYFLFAFFSGLVLAYVYYIGNINRKGILFVFLVHFIYNSIGVILKHF